MPVEETRCRLIIGLGNPGPEYEGTLHNAGFMTVDKFLEKHAKSFTEKHVQHGRAWEGKFAADRLVILKPMTFMNLSGDAVGPIMRGENLTPAEILVIYDDMDLPVGKMRFRKSGGSAGHNGMKSVIAALGTENFPRLRIGIGTAAAKREADFVLSSFDGIEKEAFTATVNKAAEALELLIRRGLGEAMCRFNAVDMMPRPEEEQVTTDEKKVTIQEVDS